MVRILKWAYIACSEIIGFAGIPDDIASWNSIMGPLLELIDQSWVVRALLVLSGILVFSYRSWSPLIFRSYREAKQLRKLIAGLLADSEDNRFIRELNSLSYVLQSVCLEHDRPLSEDLSREVSEASQTLRALKIKTPKIKTARSDCPKIWHAFLEQVIPDLKTGDVERARSALELIRIPRRKWRVGPS